jgi:hypothetical protein
VEASEIPGGTTRFTKQSLVKLDHLCPVYYRHTGRLRSIRSEDAPRSILQNWAQVTNVLSYRSPEHFRRCQPIVASARSRRREYRYRLTEVTPRFIKLIAFGKYQLGNLGAVGRAFDVQ